jgi:hypothetical protein
LGHLHVNGKSTPHAVRMVHCREHGDDHPNGQKLAVDDAFVIQ